MTHDPIDTAGAWAVTRGENVRVAVLDTGYTGDPVRGRVLLVRDFTGAATGTADPGGHGTAVAGVVRAVAPACRILVGKVHSDGHPGATSSQWVEAGLEWAVANGAVVVNMSVDLGRRDLFPDLHAAVRRAAVAGVVITCAAGNTGDATHLPAAWPEVISVGEVWDRHGDGTLALTDTSCRGPDLDAVGPWGAWGRYGTSFCSPAVAGAAALYVSARGPGWSPAEFRSLLRSTGRLVAGAALPQCGALARAAKKAGAA